MNVLNCPFARLILTFPRMRLSLLVAYTVKLCLKLKYT